MSHRSQKFQAWPFITSSWISPHSLRNPNHNKMFPSPQEKKRNKLWTTQLEYMFFSSFMPLVSLVACSWPIQTMNLYGICCRDTSSFDTHRTGDVQQKSRFTKGIPSTQLGHHLLVSWIELLKWKGRKKCFYRGEVILQLSFFRGYVKLRGFYCWWKKFCITSDVWNLNGRHYLSTGAGFLLATVLNIEVMFKVKTI